jgi:hypothetical protein
LLQDNSKRTSKEYVSLLTKWNLFSEKELIENNTIIQTNLTTEALKRIYYKVAFEKDGKYNWKRYNQLKNTP